MTDRDIVIMSVDRSEADTILVNTAVEFLHCPIYFPKELLRSLGYTVYRPQKLKPIIYATVYRHVERNGGKLPMGGIRLSPDDIEGLPQNPVQRA